jgi:hypothetical protein
MRKLSPNLPLLASVLSATVILLGALAWFRPHLTIKRLPVAGVPAPAALSAVSQFAVPSKGRACMNAVTVSTKSEVAAFQFQTTSPVSSLSPTVELVLVARGYQAVATLAGVRPKIPVRLPISPPKHTVIATACFVNRSHTPVLFDGTTEPRTISRSETLVNGRPIVGDIALAFYERRSLSPLERLGTIFEHASNLTDGLLPAWLIWVVAVLVCFGVPCAVVLAFYLAIREDEERPNDERIIVEKGREPA